MCLCLCLCGWFCRHSIQEPETLEEVFRKRVIEFDPQLGLSVSKSVRRRSLELVDTLVLPLSGVDKDGRISLGSFPRLRVSWELEEKSVWREKLTLTVPDDSQVGGGVFVSSGGAGSHL